MSITLHWQHFILLIGFVCGLCVLLKDNSDDRYGIGAFILFCGTLIVWLTSLVVYFGLYYFGAFT